MSNDEELFAAHKQGATLPLDVAARLIERGYILDDTSTAETEEQLSLLAHLDKTLL